MKNLKKIGYGGVLSAVLLIAFSFGAQSVFGTVQMTPEDGGGGGSSAPVTSSSGQLPGEPDVSNPNNQENANGPANDPVVTNPSTGETSSVGTQSPSSPTPAQTPTPQTSSASSANNTPTTPNPGAQLAPVGQDIVNGTSSFTKTDFSNGIVSCGRETVVDTSKLSQPQLNTLSRQIATSCGFQEFMFFLQRLVNYALIIATLLMVFSIGYTGYEFFMAGDKPGELKKLKGRLLDIVIGSVILLASWLIFNTVASYLPTALQSYIYLTNVKQ